MSELETFCETLYGNAEGLVYSPLKDPATGKWTVEFFKWPSQRKALYEHIESNTRTAEVYIAPSLFSFPKVGRDYFLSSRTVWVEFDGGIPIDYSGIPAPTVRIQSSDPGHEHWYWLLENDVTDASIIELINKKLAYTLGADLSGWDCIQVLRPPVTIHHDSGKTVSRKSEYGGAVRLTEFAHIEDPSIKDIDVTTGQASDLNLVMGLYKWDMDTLDLFLKPELPIGERSSGLTRLAFSCSEMGMSNEDIMAVLLYKDDHWKKYTKRSDRLKRLNSIIQHVRSVKQSDQIKEASHTLQALRFGDFLKTDIRIDWIVKGVLPVAGQLVVFGEAGCGKTTLILRLAAAIAQGKDYLHWKTLSQKRILFVSAEMPHEELREFFDDMDMTSTLGLQENLFIYPIGHGFPLNKKENQTTILDLLDQHDIDIVVFDSLSVVAGGSTIKDDIIIPLNEWVNENIRVRRKCSVIHIHHSRKPDKLESLASARKLSDLYGSTFIATNALTVIGMERKGDNVSLFYTKGRYLKKEQEKLLATDNRDYLPSYGSNSLKDTKDTNETRSKSRPTTDNSKNDESSPNLFRFKS